MKKLLVLLLVGALAMGAVACSSTQSSSSQESSSSISESVSSEESSELPDSMPEEGAPEFTIPEENQKLGDMITGARNAEDNEYLKPLMSAEDPQADLIFELLGLKPEDLSAYAISISPMNIKAYGVAILQPAEGKAEAVLKAANDWVSSTQKSFENYLPDQFEISKTATVDQLEDGTVVLVMAEDGADVQKSILEALKQ